MKGYKVFNPDWTCREKQYTCPGIFEQEGELKLCENGIHFCKDLDDCFNYYDFNSDNKVAEIEAIGEIIVEEDRKKCCTSKIKIIRELSWYEVLDLVNIGKNNTGFNNSGDSNTGDYNAGEFNTGDYNTGEFNTGDYNTGDFNTGDYNAGHYNSGNFNAGHFNTGNCNTGNYNSGSFNVGNYNISNGSFGCFNTHENEMFFFNKRSTWTYEDWIESKAKKILNRMAPKLNWVSRYKMTKKEKEEHPEYKTINGLLECREEEELYSLRQEWWENLSKEDKDSVLNLPNFDISIFKKITGIDVTIEK